MMNYAARCLKCGKWSATQTNNITKKVFHCKYCNTKRKLKQKNIYGIPNTQGPYKTNQTPQIIIQLNSK